MSPVIRTRADLRPGKDDALRVLVRSALAALFVSCLGFATARAQADEVEVHLSSSVDAPVVGEPFQIQVETRLAGQVLGGLEPPDFGALRVIGRSGVMRSQQITSVFGAAPRIELREMVAFAVVAEQPGTYRIGPVRYRYGRRTATSDTLVLKVSGVGTNVDPNALSPAQPDVAAESAEFDRQAFVRAVVDRTEAFVGQQVTLTVYLYVNDQLPVRDARATHAPSTTGFWVQDLRTPQSRTERDHQVVRGVGFQVYVLRRLALFPLQAGTLETGETEMAVDVGDPLAAMMGQTTVLSPRCAPIRIDVRPLPAGAPLGTLVGRATLSADVDRRSLRTGEAATLTVTVRGVGSLRDVAFATPVVPGLRFEAPTIEDRLETPGDVVGGERILRWQVVPLVPGRVVLPELTLSVFDPTTERLDTLRSASIALDVTGDAIADEEPDAGLASSEDDEAEDDADAIEFGPPSRSSALLRHVPALSSHPLYLPALLAAPLSVALLFVSRDLLRRLAERRDRRASAPTPDKPLADAKRALVAKDATAFYAALSTALHRALERSLGVRTVGMTHHELRDHLASRGGDEDLCARIVDELDASDFARFSASGSDAAEMQLALDRVRALIERIGKADFREVAP